MINNLTKLIQQREVQLIFFLVLTIYIILKTTSKSNPKYEGFEANGDPEIQSQESLSDTMPCDLGCEIPESQARYYKTLQEMTPAQIIKFKNKAKPGKMTMLDYKSWLSLFEYDKANLPTEHHENLDRLLKGLPIMDIPLPTMIDDLLKGSAQEIGQTTITIEVPNTEIDSPVNYDPKTTYDTSGEIDKNNNTDPHRLRYGGYAGFADFRNSNKNKIERTKDFRAGQWFQQGSFPWIFDSPESGYLFKENRFENVIKNNQEGRQACCRAKQELKKLEDTHLRPKFFDFVDTTEEKILGPRPRKFPEGLYTYPSQVTGLGQGSSYQGSVIDPNRLDKYAQRTQGNQVPEGTTSTGVGGAGTLPAF
jgi:hypothetical protein